MGCQALGGGGGVYPPYAPVPMYGYKSIFPSLMSESRTDNRKRNECIGRIGLKGNPGLMGVATGRIFFLVMESSLWYFATVTGMVILNLFIIGVSNLS